MVIFLKSDKAEYQQKMMPQLASRPTNRFISCTKQRVPSSVGTTWLPIESDIANIRLVNRTEIQDQIWVNFELKS